MQTVEVLDQWIEWKDTLLAQWKSQVSTRKEIARLKSEYKNTDIRYDFEANMQRIARIKELEGGLNSEPITWTDNGYITSISNETFDMVEERLGLRIEMNILRRKVKELKQELGPDPKTNIKKPYTSEVGKKQEKLRNLEIELEDVERLVSNYVYKVAWYFQFQPHKHDHIEKFRDEFIAKKRQIDSSEYIVKNSFMRFSHNPTGLKALLCDQMGKDYEVEIEKFTPDTWLVVGNAEAKNNFQYLIKVTDKITKKTVTIEAENIFATQKYGRCEIVVKDPTAEPWDWVWKYVKTESKVGSNLSPYNGIPDVIYPNLLSEVILEHFKEQREIMGINNLVVA